MPAESSKWFVRWGAASLLWLTVGTITACDDEHAPVAAVAEPAQAQALPAQTLLGPRATQEPPRSRLSLPPAGPRRPPLMRTLPNGRVAMSPQEPVDVATLQRQPDGTIKQVCGAPNEDARAVLEMARRRRGGTP